MFIKGIVVPLLIIALVLFLGVTYNDTNSGTRNNGTGIYQDGTNGITTTPILNDGNSLDINGTDNMAGMNTDMMGNGNTTSMNGNYSGADLLTRTQIKNEIERINGVNNASVLTRNGTLCIALDTNTGETLGSSSNTTNTTIREEIRRVIRNIDSNIRTCYVIVDDSAYRAFENNNTNINSNTNSNTSNTRNNNNGMDFSRYLTKGNLLTIY